MAVEAWGHIPPPIFSLEILPSKLSLAVPKNGQKIILKDAKVEELDG